MFSALLTTFALASSAPPPVEDFARMPLLRNVRVSPSGHHVSALVRPANQDEYSFAVFDISNGFNAIYSTKQDEKFRIRHPTWISDEKIVFSVYFNSERYNVDTVETRLFALTPQTGQSEWLFKGYENNAPQIQDDIVSLLPNDPKSILVQYYKDGQFRVFTVPVDAKKRHPTYFNGRQHISNWIADNNGVIRSGWGIKNNKSQRLMILTPDDKWVDISHRVAEGAPRFRVLGFPNNRNKAFIASNHETDTDALYLYDIAPDSFDKQLFHNEVSDVYSIVQRKEDGAALGVTFAEAEGDIHWFGENFVRDTLTKLHKAFSGQNVSITNLSLSDNAAIVFADSDNQPGHYGVFDIENNSLMNLPSQYPELDGIEMGHVIATSYKARDGLEIPAFVTLPPGINSLDEAKGLPFVINPHGGPNARDFVGFNWETQFLASRGYGVLQMNFRGSSGYGESFKNAGNRQWGQAMQDDITDGTQWLIDTGKADPDRIAIMGASYGGYAALMGLAKTPDAYQCAVVHGAVTDLPAIIRDASKYIGGRYRTRHIGKLWGDRKMLVENSPVERVDDMVAPILIFQGEEDRVVDVDQARRLTKALKRKKHQFEYVELPDGSHYLDVKDNRLTYLSKVETYLQGCLN